MREVLPWLLFFIFMMNCSSIVGGNKGAAAGGEGRGGADPLDFLSSIKGAYTHFVDDDLSVTLSYDLHDDSNMPFSFLTGCVRAVATLWSGELEKAKDNKWVVVELHTIGLHVQ